MADNGKFKEGERVLLSGPHDDIPDEFAVVLEHEGDEMYMVQVEKAVDSSDDRLREISGKFMSRV